jgi:all-trans-8'-apo-beta-carotenal 15,15'-oxygenase
MLNGDSFASLPPRPRAWNASLLAHPGELDQTLAADRVDGAIPERLRGGRLLSNGPGWTLIGGRVAHPFDGHGFVRALSFERDGSVRLRARFVRTPSYLTESARGRIVHRGLGTNPSDRFWANLSRGPVRNVANTTLYRWAGRLLAGWEGGAPYALDPDSLETLGEHTWGGAIAGQSTLAHVKHDATRDRLVLCSVALGAKTRVTFRELDARGVVVGSREVTLDGAMFAHDFAITPSWYVLAANPLKIRVGEFVKSLVGASTLIRCLRTDEAAPGRLWLIPREGGGAARSIALDRRAFVVHFANAFEREGAVVVDGCAFESFGFGQEFGFQGPSSPLDPALPDQRAPQRLVRVTIPAGASQGALEELAPDGADFPRVHPRHDGLETPAVFAATRAERGKSDPFDALVRVDLRDPTRPAQRWRAPDNVFVGEPLFAPSPEDPSDGHVLALLSDAPRARTTLAVFSARDLAAGPVAAVHAPLLPYGFHGMWDAPRAE